MKLFVKEILDGKFQYEGGNLDFSCSRIDLSLPTDTKKEDSFTIYGPEGRLTEGFVSSTDLRVTCVTKEFSGTKDEIYYIVDTDQVEPGSEIKGAFHIISNQGEFVLPYCVSVISGSLQSSLGDIKNLFHFTNLAKTNWNEAIKLFYSPDFESVLAGNDRQYLSAYRGLSKYPGNDRNMEEFLIEIHKKQAVEYMPEEEQIKLEDPDSDTRYTLVITKNGWGYTHFRIEVEGGFIYINESEVGEDRFLGNTYRLHYYIRTDMLHNGNNYGYIRIISAEKMITVPVIINCAPVQRRLVGLSRDKKRNLVQIMDYYQAFRLKKISVKTWMSETGKLIERIQSVDEKDLAILLYKCHLLITEERYNEAQWFLTKNEERVSQARETDPELFGYYMYLTTLISREENYINRVADKIGTLYEQNPSNWRLAWLFMYLSDEFENSYDKKWNLLRRQFDLGCSSPIIYIEAWNLLCANPSMLLSLDEFELQVLLYAVKKEVMREEVLLQLLYLVQKQKDYSEALVKILMAAYEIRRDNEVLQAICSLLIKGNKSGRQYFEWYSQGVEEGLRITRLFDYYMMSLPLDETIEIPKMVLMYFSYQSDLPYERTAYLYSYVLKLKEEKPDLYASYVPAIERFVLEQINLGHINKDLAYIYRQMITAPMIDEENASILMKLLFMREIRVENPKIKNVVVIYPYVIKESVYPVEDGRIQVPVYDADSVILLEDEDQNRFTVSIPYEKERLFSSGKISLMAAPFVKNMLGYAISVCFENKSFISIFDENADRFREIADSDVIEESYRREIRAKLVAYYYDKDRLKDLDAFLESLSPEDIAPADKKEVINFFIIRGMYDEAYEWVKKTGPFELEPKMLVKLCSRILDRQEEWEEDPQFTGMLYYVLKHGKYDDNILLYLIKYFEGSIKDMRDIWKAAEDFGVDHYSLSERMIVQMLYTGAYVGEKAGIFKSYLQGGGNEIIMGAFLSQCCFDYVIKDQIIDKPLLDMMAELKSKGLEMHFVCDIAYLIFYGENKNEIDSVVRENIVTSVDALLARGIVLPVFKEFIGFTPSLDQFADKYILEHRVGQGQKACIHYLLHKDGNEESEEYVKEEMRNIFFGICIREFVLFFGEKIQYYITEETGGAEQLTESDSISKNDITDESGESRYALINDIVISQTLQDYDTAVNMLEEYYKRDYLVDRLYEIQ